MRSLLWPDEDGEELRREVEAYFAGGVAHLVEVLLARDSEGAVVGFAELNLRPYAEGCVSHPVAFLEGWYVDSRYRRQGVGAALVAAAERWAIARGCTEFASDTLVDNLLSTQAHLALGFEEVEVIRCFRKSLDGQPP